MKIIKEKGNKNILKELIKTTYFKIIAIIATAILLLILFSLLIKPVINYFDIKFYDFYTKQSTDIGKFSKYFPHADRNIIILTVDNLSQYEFSHTTNAVKFPLSREVWANLVNYIEKSNPKVVLLDIIFEGYETNYPKKVSNDTIFSKTLSKYNNIVLGTKLCTSLYEDCTDKLSVQYIDESSLSNYIPTQTSLNVKKNSINNEKAYFYHSLIPDIFVENAFVGATNLPQQKDNKIRSFQPVYKLIKDSKVYYVPSIAFITALKYTDSNIDDIIFERNKIKFNNHTLKLSKKKDSMINWHGANETYTTIPLTSVLTALINNSDIIQVRDTQIPRSFFENKIIIISQNTQNNDFYATSLNDNMTGAQINANIIDNLINDTGKHILHKRKMVTQTPYALNIIINLFLCLFVLYLFYIIKNNILSLLASTIIYGLFIYSTFILFLFPFTRLFFSTTLPLLFYLAICTLTITYQIFFIHKKRLKINNLFKGYVPASILNQIGKNPKTLNATPKKVNATVFICDIQHFSTYTQMYDTQYLFDKTNELFSLIITEILKHGGTFDKFIDDSVVAFWGAPYEQEDDELNAIKCAFAIKEKLKNSPLKLDYANKFDINIAIGTADSIVGLIGKDKYTNYTILGNGFNLALKIKKLCDKSENHILVSENTYEKTKDKFLFSYKGEVKIKSQGLIVKVYEPKYENQNNSNPFSMFVL